jgi:hypothetical protein
MRNMMEANSSSDSDTETETVTDETYRAGIALSTRASLIQSSQAAAAALSSAATASPSFHKTSSGNAPSVHSTAAAGARGRGQGVQGGVGDSGSWDGESGGGVHVQPGGGLSNKCFSAGGGATAHIASLGHQDLVAHATSPTSVHHKPSVTPPPRPPRREKSSDSNGSRTSNPAQPNLSKPAPAIHFTPPPERPPPVPPSPRAVTPTPPAAREVSPSTSRQHPSCAAAFSSLYTPLWY